jgi:hypothetical protein
MIIDGTNGLTFNNATTQASAGCVLQVVNASTTSGFSTASSSYVSTSISGSITPKFTTSKILVLVTTQITNTSAGGSGVNATVYRNSSVDLGSTNALAYYQNNSTYSWTSAAMSALDSPATTSSATYTIYLKISVGGTAYIGQGVTSITLMEIAG